MVGNCPTPGHDVGTARLPSSTSERRSRTLGRGRVDQAFWCEKLSMCPNEMVPLQIDRARGPGKVPVRAFRQSRRRRHCYRGHPRSHSTGASDEAGRAFGASRARKPAFLIGPYVLTVDTNRPGSTVRQNRRSAWRPPWSPSRARLPRSKFRTWLVGDRPVAPTCDDPLAVTVVTQDHREHVGKVLVVGWLPFRRVPGGGCAAAELEGFRRPPPSTVEAPKDAGAAVGSESIPHFVARPEHVSRLDVFRSARGDGECDRRWDREPPAPTHAPSMTPCSTSPSLCARTAEASSRRHASRSAPVEVRCRAAGGRRR